MRIHGDLATAVNRNVSAFCENLAPIISNGWRELCHQMSLAAVGLRRYQRITRFASAYAATCCHVPERQLAWGRTRDFYVRKVVLTDILPSPLAGEGDSAKLSGVRGKGTIGRISFTHLTSPHPARAAARVALSLRGRGVGSASSAPTPHRVPPETLTDRSLQMAQARPAHCRRRGGRP